MKSSSGKEMEALNGREVSEWNILGLGHQGSLMYTETAELTRDKEGRGQLELLGSQLVKRLASKMISKSTSVPRKHDSCFSKVY
jgi:hypothetical protein